MNEKVIAAVSVLVIVVALFAYLNSRDAEDRLLSQREARIFIVSAETRETVDFETVLELEEHQFTATLRSSDGGVRDHTYTGVRLRDLLEHHGLDVGGAEQVITRAADGYAVALTRDEVMDDDNVYIVYMIDGQPMASREEGGSGPYQVIIRKDEFAQRWNKYLMEIEIR